MEFPQNTSPSSLWELLSLKCWSFCHIIVKEWLPAPGANSPEWSQLSSIRIILSMEVLSHCPYFLSNHTPPSFSPKIWFCPFHQVFRFRKTSKGSLQNSFLEKVGHSAQQGGGGLTEAQVFVEIFQNQICLGKWPKMWWNTQYINGGAISYQFMRVLDPPIRCPNQKNQFFMKK